jgi:diacylglycerol O-acyltransferase
MATGPDQLRDAGGRDVAGGNRMSDLEAVMWHVEEDPFLSSTFGSVTILDRPPDVRRLARRLRIVADGLPRLRQRVVGGTSRLAPPVWQLDPDFDLDHHLRRVALPAPGDRPMLLDLACRWIQDPLDRHRPLWQFLIVEGLEGGRAAMVQKMHHAITDGVGGVRMSEQFLDLTADAPEPGARLAQQESTSPDDDPSVVGALAHHAGRLAGMARDVAVGVTEDLRHPTRALGRPADVAAAVRSTARQLTVLDRARSPLWTDRSLQRAFATLDVDFDDVRRASKALGGSINDLFVTGAVGGAGDYHRQLGMDVGDLRMAMAVSTRQDRSVGGNAFVPARMLVPAGIIDPVERFARVHEILSAARREPALGLAGTFAGLAVLLPTPVLTWATRRQVETVDFATSNLRGAPFDLYVAGARIDATYAIGPLAGCAFNLTTMSYCGSLHMGLHVDRAAISEPARLHRCLAASFAELIQHA